MGSIEKLQEMGAISIRKKAGAGNNYTLKTSTEIGTSTKNGTGTKNGTTPVPKTVPVPVPKTVLEPKREPKKNLSAQCADKFAHFEDFWKAYPRKVDKKRAKAAWGRIAKGVRLQIIEHVQNRPWPKDKSFVMHPTTFLNNERWEDDTAATDQTQESYF